MVVAWRRVLTRGVALMRVNTFTISARATQPLLNRHSLMVRFHYSEASVIADPCAEEKKKIVDLQNENATLKSDIMNLRKILNVPLHVLNIDDQYLSIHTVASLAIDNARLREEKNALEARLKSVERELGEVKKEHAVTTFKLNIVEKEQGELKKELNSVVARLDWMDQQLGRRAVMARLESLLVAEVKAIGAKDSTILPKASKSHSSLHKLRDFHAGYRKLIANILTDEELEVLVQLKGEGNLVARSRGLFTSREKITSFVKNDNDPDDLDTVKTRLLNLLFDRLSLQK
eukprot:m.142663 g.142663  ORF g.142663 m.142663 type:complete len:290 (-) comp9652_c0_seq3:2605-3474(-)